MISTDPSARLTLSLEPTQVGLLLGALAAVQEHLFGPGAEFVNREITALARDIREQVAEQSNEPARKEETDR